MDIIENSACLQANYEEVIRLSFESPERYVALTIKDADLDDIMEKFVEWLRASGFVYVCLENHEDGSFTITQDYLTHKEVY